jgi:hypothetical protein
LKKGLAIVFLVVFLFNVGGYYVVFWGLRFHTDQKLTDRVKANLYQADEIVEIKIPVTLPYPIQDQGFQPVDGRFEHNGEHFKLIKHKYDNDTLYVVCIRDFETRRLVNTMRNYVELTNGFDGTAPNQKALNFLSKLIKDFCSHDSINIVCEFSILSSDPFFKPTQAFIGPVLPVHSPPPRA